MLTLFNLIWQQEILNLIDVSSITENGNFYPTLLLCLKELETLKGQVGIINFFFVCYQLIVGELVCLRLFFHIVCQDQIDFQFLFLWRFKVCSQQ